MNLPIAQVLHRQGDWSGEAETCHLDYAARFLRRKRLTTDAGEAFVADLSQTTSLNDGDALRLSDGRLIRICAANEALLAVTGKNLTQLAWHIGNRHMPAQIDDGRILIQRDHVIRDMLARLGAELRDVEEPFTPEGGAYGHGRTHSHSHGHEHGAAHAHPH